MDPSSASIRTCDPSTSTITNTPGSARADCAQSQFDAVGTSVAGSITSPR